ncbi:MAG: HNH endonuclease signature motif containing protein [Sulfurimonas sp.]|jgi:5-methylcytosine-specific restriction protein A|nr:HNH endonuclease signature motif containing protein [Sulfurimonadaceae bacterium]
MSDIFWQAPGNGKAFDSFIGDDSKMNNRSIGVLSFIKEHSKDSGYVKESFFSENIKKYLEDYFNEIPNNSLDTHFYKPLLFYGFIHRDKNYNLSLSIEGNIFLKKYKDKKYLECRKILINQLDNTVYPNDATPQVKNLNLYPFRILFKILLDSKKIDTNFIKSSLIRIVNFEDLRNYLDSKKLSDINSFEINSSKYEKFNTWVINSLVDLKILKREKGILKIDDEMIEHIAYLYKNIDYEDMFGTQNEQYYNEINISKKRTKRDYKVIDEAKKRDRFICVVNKNHDTFLANGNNYTEGHHLIPMFQQKNFDFSLDTIENIATLCPNCHREVHFADNKKEILDILYEKQQDFLSSYGVQKIDLFSIYKQGL